MWLYTDGKGIPQDSEKAVFWLEKAANQGDAQHQYWLGKRYADGKGIPQNSAKAVYWIRKAADSGFSSATYWLEDNQ